HQSELVDRLWAVVEKPERGKEQQRLRAAAALANYDPDSQRWDKVVEQVANDLVSAPLVYLANWMESFRRVREEMLAPLGVVYRDAQRRETERYQATAILADYSSDRPSELAELLLDADEKQFAVLYPKFKEQGAGGLPLLSREIEEALLPDATED